MSHADCWAQVLMKAGRCCGGDGEGEEPEPLFQHRLPPATCPHWTTHPQVLLRSQVSSKHVSGVNNSRLMKASIKEGLAGVFTPQSQEKF